jgi:hypothetical protein
MKFFLSILLLLTTAFYVLPVKELLTAGNDVCFADMEKEKEDSNKKEKSKELFSFSTVYTITEETYSDSRYFLPFFIPVILHTVETPPPDIA